MTVIEVVVEVAHGGGQRPDRLVEEARVVIGDEDGGLQANYHGTTVLTQLMRGMWPDFLKAFEEQGLVLVRSVQ